MVKMYTQQNMNAWFTVIPKMFYIFHVPSILIITPIMH